MNRFIPSLVLFTLIVLVTTLSHASHRHPCPAHPVSGSPSPFSASQKDDLTKLRINQEIAFTFRDGKKTERPCTYRKVNDAQVMLVIPALDSARPISIR